MSDTQSLSARSNTTTLPSLLPPNATALERRAAQVCAWDASANRDTRMRADLIPTLWNADTCPVHLLPVLAWAESVDSWDPAWPEATKRAVINASRAVHRHKGTVGAVESVLASLGHANAEVMDRSDLWDHNGKHLRNGQREHGNARQWARFKIFLQRHVSDAEATAIRYAVMQVKRNCCELAELRYPVA